MANKRRQTETGKVNRVNEGASTSKCESTNPDRLKNKPKSFLRDCHDRLQQFFLQPITRPVSPPQLPLDPYDERIDSRAERLANDVIRYLLREETYIVSEDPVARSMRHNVYQMLNKHNILFTSMVNRLNIKPETAYESFMGVARELFSQGISWARIISLYAFVGRLALWAQERNMYQVIQRLPSFLARFMQERIASFIRMCGGWNQLCVEYPANEEMSYAIWKSLWSTGASLALVAVILMVTSRYFKQPLV